MCVYAHTHARTHIHTHKECNKEWGGRQVIRQNLKSLVVVFIACRGEFLTQFWRHGRIECDGCQKRANSIALENSRSKCWPKVCVLTWGIQNIHVSAVGRSCLEGVYTVRSQKDTQEMSQRRSCYRQLTICSLFWLGLVTSEELWRRCCTWIL